jgi:hypothetical protein
MGWRFMRKLEEQTTKGKLAARCLLCHSRMLKKKNILDIVEKNIIGKQCENLTAHGLG